MRRHGNRAAARGFTLVELLLAVTLMSLLLALAYGGLRAASRATDRGQDLLEETGRMRLAHQFVRRQLNQILPLPYATDEAEQLTTLFEGGGRYVQFVAPMPGYLSSGGPYVQRLDLVDGVDGVDLVFRQAPLQGFEEPALDDHPPVTLLAGLDYGSFEFQERDEEGLPGGWLMAWPEPAMVPLAVRLNIEYPEDSQVTWPPLVTGVRLDPSAIAYGGQQRDYTQSIRDMIRNRRRDNEQ